MRRSAESESAATEPQARMARRKAGTRAALVGAARGFLAEPGGKDPSIQEITDAADVGFGTFYNHFETKAELFAVALEEILDELGSYLDEVTEGLDDPAQVVAVRSRLIGRLTSVSPQITSTLVNAGPRVLFSDRGLAPRLRADIVRGMAAGRFLVQDADLAMACFGGSLAGALQLVQAREHPAVDTAIDTLAEHQLRLLGVAAGEAHALAHAPLPG